MHIILSILGAIVTILFYLSIMSRSGLNFRWLTWLDPFAWNRRRKWQQTLNADPAFTIKDPMEATACLLFVAAKCSGEISREQKETIVRLFEEEFHMNETRARELLTSCSFMIPDEQKIIDRIEGFLEPSLLHFDQHQKDAALELLGKVITCEGQPTEKQTELVEKVKLQFFGHPRSEENKWGHGS
ncbi:MAG: TerB family tellurite resistance protein [Alphaproteobacteria bacterium]|nr:TerB family tellurite resistance protein [Alphaproteobacteria bacterium]